LNPTPNTLLVVCDLGNVLFRIDFQRTIAALEALPGYNGRKVEFGVDDQDPIFERFDCGEVDRKQFYEGMRERFGLVAPDAQIEQAWNAILIGPYPFAVQIPAELRARFQPEAEAANQTLRVVLLSNISEPHLDVALATLPLANPATMGLDAAYYSCRLGVRKPNPAAFLRVCELEGVAPAQCVLFDDSAANVEAARGLGFRASRVTPGDRHLAFRELA
jgi:putative hydrolase of the HAD superfamily